MPPRGDVPTAAARFDVGLSLRALATAMCDEPVALFESCFFQTPLSDAATLGGVVVGALMCAGSRRAPPRLVLHDAD